MRLDTAEDLSPRGHLPDPVRAAWQHHHTWSRHARERARSVEAAQDRVVWAVILGVPLALCALAAGLAVLAVDAYMGAPAGLPATIRVALAVAACALAVPAALHALGVTLRAHARLRLRRAGMTAARTTRTCRLTLPDAIWAVTRENSVALSSRLQPEELITMSSRAARTIVRRYGAHSLVGGRLYDLTFSPAGRLHPLVTAWTGTVETFLAAVEPLDERTWKLLLTLTDRCAGEPDQALEILERLVAQTLDDDQHAAVRTLARRWHGTGRDLLDAAVAL